MPCPPEHVFGELLLETRGTGELPDAPVFSDSRRVAPGSIFVAVPGTKIDGNRFIADALRAGAAAVVHTETLAEYPPDVLFCRVGDARAALSLLCRHRCGAPDHSLLVYGVTGTNGKTTSAYLIRHLLEHAGIPCGLVSTVEYFDGRDHLPPTHTTPDPQTLFPLLEAMLDHGEKAAAMEFSSHALAQKRLHGMTLRGAIFTNLTGDHLDFHHDMESYYQAKKSLFTDLLIPGGIAAVNIDTDDGVRLARELAAERPDLKIPTFGRNPDAGWRISETENSVEGCKFVLSNALQAFQASFPLPGDYNISNLAGVLTLLLCDGIPPEAVDRALCDRFSVPGRLEKFTAPSGATFFVDYAHTDDALRNVLRTVKTFCRGRLIALFGAGGDRDRSKRPRMGAAAAEFADRIIVTSDNPRSEDPESIMREVAAGIPAGTDAELIVSRREAIARAAALAGAEDIVVIAGKGHENYQEISGIRHHFDDREELTRILNDRG